MSKLALTVVALCSFLLGMTQDIHFSQFYVSPFNLNPADIGAFYGDYRAIAQYRTQWRSVTVPYNTFSIAGDSPSIVPIEGVSAGISLYRDQTGDSRFTTTHAMLGGSYTIPVATDSSQTIRVGALTGVSHMGLDYSQLNYDSQFDNGVFDPGIDPNEIYARSQRTWLAAHIGASYHWNRPNGEKYSGGIAFYNINAPKQSLFDDLGVKLDGRVQLHAQADFPLNDDWDLLPSSALRIQGKYTEWLIGGRGRYTVVDIGDDYRAVYAGVFARTKDAGYIVAGMDINQWQMGVSYDINLSDLKVASNGRGGLELSLVYIWKNFKPQDIKHRICPEYI